MAPRDNRPTAFVPIDNPTLKRWYDLRGYWTSLQTPEGWHMQQHIPNGLCSGTTELSLRERAEKALRQIRALIVPPKRPALLQEVIAELEAHGADSVRIWLSNQTDTRREFLDRFGNAVIRRAEAEDWLKWNAARDGYSTNVVVLATVVAATFAILSVVK